MKAILLIGGLLLFFNLGAQEKDFSTLKSQYDSCQNNSQFNQALMLAKQMNELAFSKVGDTSLLYAESFRHIGNSLKSLGEKDSALAYLNKSLSLLVSQNREKSVSASFCYSSIGNLFFEASNFKKAEFSFLKAQEAIKLVIGEENQEYAEVVTYLARVYVRMGFYLKAESFYLQALGIRKKVFGEEDPDYAASLNDLGNVYSSMGNYKKAESFYFQALTIYKSSFGEYDSYVSVILNNIGSFYFAISDFKKAETFYDQSLDIRRKIFGGKGPDFATSLSNLGSLYNLTGQYDKAELYFKQSLEILKNIYGDDSPRTTSNLISLGLLYSNKGEFKTAEQFYIRSLAIKKKIFGESNPEYALGLQSFGNYYFKIGEYFKSDSCFSFALRIYREVYGNNNLSVANTLNSLGLMYSELSDLTKPELYFNQALDIYKQVFGPNHFTSATVFNNLGLFYTRLGDFSRAESYFTSARNIYTNNFGNSSAYLANCFNSLGVLFSSKNDFKKAESFYIQSFEMRKNVLGDRNPEYVNSLINLGAHFVQVGDYKKAQNYLSQSLILCKEVFGEVNSNYANALNNIGFLYLKINEFQNSESFLNQSLSVKKKIFGETSPNTITTENLLATLFVKTNRESQAYSILLKNISKLSNFISINFEWLSENQREFFWSKENSNFDKIFSLLSDIYNEIPEASGLSFNTALLVKGKLLETKISTENYYREIDDLRRELTIRRRVLAKLESEGSFDQRSLEKLRFEADSLDKRLTISWPEYTQQRRNLSITWEKVQQNLDEGEAAIEFVRYKNDDSLFYYNALVLKKGDLHPILVKLCKEVDLQAITPMFGSSEYYQLIWKPLDSVLLGVKTIFYAPVGELNNVSFHSIRFNDQDSQYLMDRYTLHQLTSTRYLALGLKEKEGNKLDKTIAMVGGVNYNYLPGMHSETVLVNKDGFRNEIALGRLEYLPGTKTEVEHIASIVKSNGWNIKLLSSNDAKEENVIKMEGRDAPGILHLATHGYAFPDFDFKDTTIYTGSLRYSYRYSTNSMVRSGLILTGGNWAWTGSDTLTKMGEEQNGILTALEVSQLNLKKTKLVVLSACETGLGKIEGSEGTFGLKRAFKLAGVEQIIVSLWPVPDKETMELMTLFYNDMIISLNPIISFAKAQKAMRDKYPNSPQTWAGFVLVR